MNFVGMTKKAFADPHIRNRVLFVLLGFALFRVLSAIPIPGLDPARLDLLLQSNQLLSYLALFSGGGLSALSIVMLGVGPYITATIALQLLTTASPRLKALYHEEGEAGRRQFAQYSRLLTIPLALFQAFAFTIYLQRQGVLDPFTTLELITNVSVIAAGSMLLMWIGELMNEFGIGNGVSLIIFAGIVAGLPPTLSQLYLTYDPTMIPTYIAFGAAAIAIIAGVVLINEAERSVPVTYARSVHGGRERGRGFTTYIPLKVNQAGVMPIIFALAFITFPRIAFGWLQTLSNTTLSHIGQVGASFIANQVYSSILYFVLVFLFTYFYTAITFEPKTMAENLQKSGAFVPGVRPGQATEEYIGTIVSRITFIGAAFLGLIAVLPLILQAITGNQALAIGGTAVLIVVSVILDLIKKVDAQVAMREY